VLREFWPEISRKFRLPFRGEHEPGTTTRTLPPSEPRSRTGPFSPPK